LVLPLIWAAADPITVLTNNAVTTNVIVRFKHERVSATWAKPFNADRKAWLRGFLPRLIGDDILLPSLNPLLKDFEFIGESWTKAALAARVRRTDWDSIARFFITVSFFGDIMADGEIGIRDSFSTAEEGATYNQLRPRH
jgi:hypothetical protein